MFEKIKCVVETVVFDIKRNIMLEKCCDNPDIREANRVYVRHGGRRMICHVCYFEVEIPPPCTYYDLAMAWNKSCDKELPCMELVSM